MQLQEKVKGSFFPRQGFRESLHNPTGTNCKYNHQQEKG